MNLTTIELVAIGFQTLVTVVLAGVYWGLWRQQRESFFMTWAIAWGFYGLRIGFITWFVLSGERQPSRHRACRDQRRGAAIDRGQRPRTVGPTDAPPRASRYP